MGDALTIDWLSQPSLRGYDSRCRDRRWLIDAERLGEIGTFSLTPFVNQKEAYLLGIQVAICKKPKHV